MNHIIRIKDKFDVCYQGNSQNPIRFKYPLYSRGETSMKEPSLWFVGYSYTLSHLPKHSTLTGLRLSWTIGLRDFI